MRQQWCIPPQASGAFVWRMEEVLEVSPRPSDPRRPLICLDAIAQQLLRDTRTPLPPAPSRPARVDYEYERGGAITCFLFCEPLRGQRWVDVTERRTKADWAHHIQDLVDVRYPDAECIVLVLDTRNTHTPAALYEVFSPAAAKRLVDKRELHYTPKHGSWLNMAELALSVLSRPCLDQRMADEATVQREVGAWQDRQNASTCTLDWRFTTDAARSKLQRLYPALQEEQTTRALWDYGSDRRRRPASTGGISG